MIGAVPEELVEAVVRETARLAMTTVGEVEVVLAEQSLWGDGSLGCPEPGMAYAQALVTGYWLVLEAAGTSYDFRADSSGRFRLCPPGAGTPPRPRTDIY